MNYRVKQVAKLSGVSVRTLHHYDEIGLLKPARIGANGYRFYGEAELLTLQQILFYRELGFELSQIKKLLPGGDAEKVAALRSHRKALTQHLARGEQLIRTIDKTIAHLTGKKEMKSKEMFAGFDPKEQARHEKYLVERFGEPMKKRIAESKAKVKDWTKADWERSGERFHGICAELVAALKRGLPAESPEVQELIGRHYQWLKQFWTPTRESYAGHAQLIVDSELRKAYEAHHPELPEFVAMAIERFAQELPSRK